MSDASPELTAAMAETRTVRYLLAALCTEFAPSPQSGYSARISRVVLNRYREAAELQPLKPGRDGDREDTLLRYRRERDEAREQLAEVRRIVLQGGQSGESVRHQLITWLEAQP
jgi:hypothetical protein